MEVTSGGRLMLRLLSAASSGDMRNCKKEAATSSVNSPRLQHSSCARIHDHKRSQCHRKSLAAGHVPSVTFSRTSPLCFHHSVDIYDTIDI
jgi:hypothetical protein